MPRITTCSSDSGGGPSASVILGTPTPALLAVLPPFMHDLIMGTRPGEQIDHKSGDGLDNRRSNLRPTTNALNQANRRRVQSKSGFKGVSWDSTKRERPWRAHITIDGRMKFLGAFATPEEAARSYDVAARALFGEFAATNEDLGLLARSGVRSAT